MDTQQLDQAVESLTAAKEAWVRLAPADKLAMLRQLLTRLLDVDQRWVDLAVHHKGIDPGSPWVGEEWVMGPWAVADAMDGLVNSLQAISAGRVPCPPRTSTRSTGQLVAHVFPADIYDRLLLNDLTVEVWMQPGVTADNLGQHTAAYYRQLATGDPPPGMVTCVLGAGNVASIPALDTLHELFVRGRTVILKMNPANDYLGPVMEELFAPLVDAGFLRFAYGGADVGDYLVHHPAVDAVHITGSVRSFETIVFGPGEEGRQRKQANEPLLKKPISSELGGVVPVIIVPGPWTDEDLAYQAENIVTMKLHNTGCNCVSAQTLLLPQAWDRGPALLNAVRQVLDGLPPRPVYYPGAAEREAAVVGHYPQAELICAESRRTLISDLDADTCDDYGFTEEFFGPIMAQTSLPGDTPSEYLLNAVRFCNERLHGTLGVTILIHPATIRQIGPMLDAAIGELRYGAIGVNVWCAGAFLLAQAAWGGYPGHSPQDIQSGSGFVHNCLMFDKPEKSVVRGSFYALPRAWRHRDFHIAPAPLWFVTNKTAATTARRVARFVADPNPLRLPAIFSSALRG